MLTVVIISAAINFTKDKLDLNTDGEFGKDHTDFLKENETTISVSWSGGGQNLKPCTYSFNTHIDEWYFFIGLLIS